MRLIFVLMLSFFSLNVVLAKAELPQQVDAPKTVSDRDLQERLSSLFKATEWFPNLKVEVKEGLVVLHGQVESNEKKTWLVKVIEKTDGVVAIVDKLDNSFSKGSVLSPAHEEVNNIFDRAERALPYLLSGAVILLLFIVFAFIFRKIVSMVLIKRKINPLLIEAISNVGALLLFLLGVYLAINSTGLSGLAVTVLGGTGFIGIGIGLALKGTVENYSASLMISLREIFRKDELVEINGFQGFVQSVTTRGTTLMDADGNQILIPNSKVFDSIIKNITRNPNSRCDFMVGIGYESSIDKAREIILKVLSSVPDVILSEPEYFVLVNKLNSSTVDLKVYFWINNEKVSKIKTLSLVMQKTKEALQAAGISLPNDIRQISFPETLKISQVEYKSESQHITTEQPSGRKVSLSASHDLTTEAKIISEQYDKSVEGEKGKNLLETNEGFEKKSEDN